VTADAVRKPETEHLHFMCRITVSFPGRVAAVGADDHRAVKDQVLDPLRFALPARAAIGREGALS
jgi:hypothetical protein